MSYPLDKCFCSTYVKHLGIEKSATDEKVLVNTNFSHEATVPTGKILHKSLVVNFVYG